MESLLKILDLQMERPEPYGWFHLLFCGLVIVVSVLLCLKFKDCNDRTFRKILLIFWVVLLILEIYKEVNFTFEVTDAGIVGKYPWYIFPFQFCSTPFFVLPLMIFLKDGRVRDGAMLFMATFSLFAGLSCYFLPESVFISTVGVNIQTMVHHGSQIVLGVFVAAYARKKFSVKNYLFAFFLFVLLCGIATGMNESFYHFVSKTETFNMFFISRHFPCTLAVLDRIYPRVPYFVFLAIYLFGFAILGFLVFELEKQTVKLIKKAG